jgi:hypothetical protein
LNSIDAERLKFLQRRRKPFRRRPTFAWRAFVTSELVKLHGQQYHCSVCSWLQRDRDGGVDHFLGLGPVRAASLKSSPLGLVAALAQRGRVSRRRTTRRRSRNAARIHHCSSLRHRPPSATIHAPPNVTITPQSDRSRIGSKLYLSRDRRHAEVLDLRLAAALIGLHGHRGRTDSDRYRERHSTDHQPYHAQSP